MNKQIALYGGSFSPPHLGHASVIEALLRLFPCDEVWLMPSADRRDKAVWASGKHRLEMLKIMVVELFPDAKIPIIISDFELLLPGMTATYETLRQVKECYPADQFHFVLGSELFPEIETKWVRG